MSSTTFDEAPPPARKRRSLDRRFLLFIVFIAALSSIWFVRNSWSPPVTIPKPDLTTANTQVATTANQFRERVEQEPRSAEAWGQYGEVLMTHEWNSDALICFDQAWKLDPKEMRWPYLSGLLLERQDPLQALEKFDLAIQSGGDYAPLWLHKAATLARLNRTEEAEKAFQKAGELAPDHPQAWIGLARIAISRKETKRGVELLERAKKIAPKNRETLVELTRARLLSGSNVPLGPDEQAAILSGERFESMPDPIFDSIQAREVAARYAATQADSIAAKGDLQKAAEAYAELIQKRPDLLRPRLNLASVFMASGQNPLALSTLQEVVRLFPNDPLAHYSLSYAQEAGQQHDAARVSLETAIRLKPDYAEAHFALGLSEERSGDVDKAIRSYRQAIQSDARLAQAHLALGLALQKQGAIDDAIAAMTSAVRLTPRDPVPKSYLEKAKALKAGK